MSIIADLYQIFAEFFSKANTFEIIELLKSPEFINSLSAGVLSNNKITDKFEQIILDYIKETGIDEPEVNIELNLDMLKEDANNCSFIYQEFKYIVYREIDRN